MKKLKNSSGFSLIEMMLALAVLVLLVVGMQSGLDAGVKAYSDSIFESNSAALAGILNTSIGDILRHSEDVQINPNLKPAPAEGTVPDGFTSSHGIIPPETAQFIFTNYEYSVRTAYLTLGQHKPGSGAASSESRPNIVIQISNLENDTVLDLVNTGAYPDLEVQNFHVKFVAPEGTEPGNYFNVHYDIIDMIKPGRMRPVDCTVRLLNTQSKY